MFVALLKICFLQITRLETELAETKEETALLEKTNESLRATMEDMETEKENLLLKLEEKSREVTDIQQNYDNCMNDMKVVIFCYICSW